jgi:hypothetical protein
LAHFTPLTAKRVDPASRPLRTRRRGNALRLSNGTLGPRRTRRLCDGALRLDGRPLRLRGRRLNHGPGLTDRTTRLNRRTLGLSDRTLRLNGWPLRLTNRSSWLDRGALGLCHGALRLHDRTLRLRYRALRLNRRTLRLRGGTLRLGLTRRLSCRTLRLNRGALHRTLRLTWRPCGWSLRPGRPRRRTWRRFLFLVRCGRLRNNKRCLVAAVGVGRRQQRSCRNEHCSQPIAMYHFRCSPHLRMHRLKPPARTGQCAPNLSEVRQHLPPTDVVGPAPFCTAQIDIDIYAGD